MKMININGTDFKVFESIKGPKNQVTPGFTQLNVGIDVPVGAHTLPTSWVNNPTCGAITTSGNTYRKVKHSF